MGFLKALGWGMVSGAFQVAYNKKRDERLAKLIGEQTNGLDPENDCPRVAVRSTPYDQNSVGDAVIAIPVLRPFTEPDHARRLQPRWCDAEGFSAVAVKDTQGLGLGLTDKKGAQVQVAVFFPGKRSEFYRVFDKRGQKKVADVTPQWFNCLYKPEGPRRRYASGLLADPRTV